uniref:Serpentine receptor class gamma n=1 Tax=Panagrellus redivivus TaxID=6233 RepID=A0A7E4VUJ0_PANRE
MAAINRFTAIVLWPSFNTIWKWKFFAVYSFTISGISLVLLLINHIDIFTLNELPSFKTYLQVSDRIFKAIVYIVAFAFEVGAVVYRLASHSSHQINKVDTTLLIQSFISTICWLINCICYVVWSYYSIPFMRAIVNIMVLSGFTLPLLYLFVSK